MYSLETSKTPNGNLSEQRQRTPSVQHSGPKEQHMADGPNHLQSKLSCGLLTGL